MTRASFAARLLAASLVLAPLSLSIATDVRADPTPEVREAKERFDRGIDLYVQGDFGGALAQFKRAYELAPYAVVLYNLGLTYAALGRPVEAADAMAKVVANPGTLAKERVERAKEVQKTEAARIAEVKIETSVPGARIDLDGDEIATTPLAAPLKMSAGPHRVSAVLPGYVPSRKEFDATIGAPVTVRFELVPTDKKLAHLVVKGSPAGATVTIDGEVAGKTPLVSSLALLPGDHTIAIARPGYTTAKEKVTLGDGATGELSLDLAEDPVAVAANGGKAHLLVSETSSVVTIDGKPRGSLATVDLAAGPHHVHVDRAGFFAIDRDIDVPSRGDLEVPIKLEPTSDYRASYEGKAKTMRVLAWAGVVGGAVIGGGATAFMLVNKSKLDDANAALTKFNAGALSGSGGACDTSSSTDPNLAAECQQQSDALTQTRNSARTRYDLGWAGIGVGAAFLATGVVLFVAGDDPSRYKRVDRETFGLRARPIFAVTPGGGSFGVTGSF